MKVADLMTKNVAFCRANDTLSVAAQLMWEHDCGAVPVLESEEDHTIGVITDRDICMASWMQGRVPSAILVSEAMSRSLHYCSPQDGLASAENIMRQKQIRRLPVLDADKRLVGILSLADIARHAERGRGYRTKEIQPDEIASTLADICIPPNTLSASA